MTSRGERVLEEVARILEEMAVTMKEAVAMDIRIENECTIIGYLPNNTSLKAARKQRLRLSAISTPGTGDSVWLGIEPYAAIYTYGERRKFAIDFDSIDYFYKCRKSLVGTHVADLGLSILRNAHSVQCIRVNINDAIDTFRYYRFVNDFCSLDAWKEAFPSLRSVYMGARAWKLDLPPHLWKHVRGLEVPPYEANENCALLRQMESLIRNKDSAIEEVKFLPWLLKHADLLDDTLKRVRSFHAERIDEEDVDLLARSFERTKADGDNLVRLSLDTYYRSLCSYATAALERILRSRPYLHILNLRLVSSSTFVVLCPVFASSILTTLKVGVRIETAVEDRTLADGVEMLLQHPTIRDLDLTVECSHKLRKSSQMEGDSVYHFERCVAEGLRSTSLRRFHLTVEGGEEASIAALTKMYEGARENWSLMDIRLKRVSWLPWNDSWPKHSLPLPFPLTAFDFISSRNQYFSRVLMVDENTLPPGLWPLILEWCPRWGHPWCHGQSLDEWCPLWKERYDESVLFYLLTLRPDLVKGSKVESSVDADAKKSVDGPRPK